MRLDVLLRVHHASFTASIRFRMVAGAAVLVPIIVLLPERTALDRRSLIIASAIDRYSPSGPIRAFMWQVGSKDVLLRLHQGQKAETCSLALFSTFTTPALPN